MHGEDERARTVQPEEEKAWKKFLTMYRQLMECVRERQTMDQVISGSPFQPQPFGDSKHDAHK